MGEPPVFLNTTGITNTSSGGDQNGQQSPMDVLVNLLLLVATLLVISLVYYVLCYIMLNCRSSAESAAAESKSTRRAAFIKEHLMVHEWVDADQDDEEKGLEANLNSSKHESSIQCSGNNDEVASQTGAKVREECNNDDNSECSTVSLESSFDGCAICLAEYSQNQRVCESSNPACTHMFHEECMVSWLMKHHRCPICRQRYIVQTP